MEALLGQMALHGLYGALAAMGFAIIFNIPRTMLLGVGLCGALALITRTLMQGAGIGIELSTLGGATLVGFWGLYFRVHYQVPTLIFTVPGTIPMVPGSFAFKAMIGMVSLGTMGEPPPDLLQETTVNFVKTFLILGAIALGIAAPSLLFRRFRLVM